MREIEYRGKLLNGNVWIVGCLVRLSHHYFILVEEHHYESCHIWHEVDPNTVGQYTGLKANGVKIFEGDILQDEDKRIGFVEFNKGRFVGDFDGRTYYYELYLDAEKSEVIGNRHDNPELLEAGE